MKLFHKIFLCFVVIFSIAFQTAGILLINFAYENAVEQEKKYALQQFQYNKYILQSVLYSEPDILQEEITSIGDRSGFTVPVALYDSDRECIYTDMVAGSEVPYFDDSEDGRLLFWIVHRDEGSYIYVQDYVRQGDAAAYLVTETDISSVVDTHRDMRTYFQRIYLIILCIGFPLIFLLTNLFTGPIKKVGKAARRIAEGEYSERIHVRAKDEIGELAVDFNQMAGKIEEKIAELSEAARAKEDFTANFAHELKTPLTSVIGYADMLYQKDLPREQVKDAASYILNEGMRLEALSLKLMDLFVMDKQDFFLEELSVEELFDDLMPGIEPLCRKYGSKYSEYGARFSLDACAGADMGSRDDSGIRLHRNIESGVIVADFDLIKTAILNLVDNAVKAASRDIWIIGKKEKGGYKISIKDNGTGIPPAELSRITEAFYMVDKSRARKQHGAGLGMALVAKIAEIHKAVMQIESDGRTGTVVCITFHRTEGGRDEKSA